MDGRSTHAAGQVRIRGQRSAESDRGYRCWVIASGSQRTGNVRWENNSVGWSGIKFGKGAHVVWCRGSMEERMTRRGCQAGSCQTSVVLLIQMQQLGDTKVCWSRDGERERERQESGQGLVYRPLVAPVNLLSYQLLQAALRFAFVSVPFLFGEE